MRAWWKMAVSAAMLSATGALAPARDNAPRRITPAIGVYYFPGWFPSAWTPPKTWEPIRASGDREPLLGWYDPRIPSVMRQQLSWMHEYAIDYVVFDWTYSNGAEHLGEPIDTYLGIKQSEVKFALLWANHDEPTKLQDMRAITRIWLSRYMRSRNFLTVNGQPVVFIFSLQKLRDDARANGSSIKDYVAAADEMARQAGLPGLYFIGDVDDTSSAWVGSEALRGGIDAISAYNFHRKPEAEKTRDATWSQAYHGYAALDAAYRAQWTAAKSLPVAFVVPMSSGWDKRPWGGSEDPEHDRSIGSAAAFRAHLSSGRDAIAAMGKKGPGLGVICCWNEFGEGSFVEPTKQHRFDKLAQVKAVFGARPGRLR